MIFLNRLIPWLLAIFVFIIFKLAAIRAELIYLMVPLGNLAVFLSIWRLTNIELRKLKFWNFLITPIILLNSGWFFFIFLEGRLVQSGFLLILAALLWLFLEVILLYFHFRPKYQPHSLENISSYLNLVTIFLLVGSFFNFIIFLGIPFWWLILPNIVFIALLSHQLFWVSEIPLHSSIIHIIIITLISSELFLTVSFLPTSVYVNSLIVTIIYYLLAGLSRNWLLDIKELKVIRRYLINSFIALLIILATAKWA